MKKLLFIFLCLLSVILISDNVYAYGYPEEITFTETIGENTVNLYANEGTFSDNTIQKSLKCSAGDLLCVHSKTEFIPTREGYIFRGWKTSTTATACLDYSMGIYYPNYTKLYACWDEKPSEETIVSEDGCYYCANYEYEPSSGFSTKYKFFRKNEKLTGDCIGATKSDDYVQGVPFNYCVKKNNTIWFYPNGGYGEYAIASWCRASDYKCNTTWAIDNNKFKKNGYSIMGWSTSSQMNSCTNPYKKIDFSSYDKLYACWAKNESIITFNANGGSFTDESTKKIYTCANNNYKCNTNDIEATKEGYTLTGWSNNSDQSDYINPYSTIDYSNYTDLYAYWTSNADVKKATTAGCYYCENLSYFYQDYSYEFKHLYLEQNDIIPNNCSENPTSSGYVRYHSQNYCIPADATISLNANGGRFPDDTTVKTAFCPTSDFRCQVSYNIPTRDKYEFSGWSTSSNMTNCMSPTAGYNYSEYETLYACWTAIPTTPPRTTPSTSTGPALVTHQPITVPENTNNQNNNNNNSNNNSNNDITTNSSTSEVPESPKTGVEDYVFGLFLSLVIVGVSLVLINNKKEIFKKI